MLTDVLLSAAARVGAPIVKAALDRYIGGTGAAIGGQVIDMIADAAGVTPDALPTLPADKLDKAVATVEASPTPELVAAYSESQRETNKLLLAEMDKEPTFSWAWRPAGMWAILALWIWTMVVVPVVNAATGAGLAGPDGQALIWLTTTYFALYMGGHTIKQVTADLAGAKKPDA